MPARSNQPEPPASDKAAPSSRPAAAKDKRRPAAPPLRREPSATDILRELTKPENAPRRPVVRPTIPGRPRRTQAADEAVPTNAIATPDRKLLPDGFRIADRPGRLFREAGYFVFSFESRGRGAPELPIRLLPNRLLEDMEMQSAGGKKPIVFVVSGEVTEYHGVNYLLVQKLLIRPDLGNLR
ncbi:MAG: hypothetical protein ACE5F9_07875 [Phycisphaerae bacterium]